MFELKEDVLIVTMPADKTQHELLEMAKEELKDDSIFFGKDIKVNGRITTGLAMWLGHRLAHVCKSVSIFAPMNNSYDLVIKH